MSYFRHHVFFCTNQREDGRACCGQGQAQALRDYMKSRCKALGLSGPGQARINTAGCMDRCDRGPVLVIYPEAIWYTYIDRDDIDEIIETHLRGGQTVERLRIP